MAQEGLKRTTKRASRGKQHKVSNGLGSGRDAEDEEGRGAEDEED